MLTVQGWGRLASGAATVTTSVGPRKLQLEAEQGNLLGGPRAGRGRRGRRGSLRGRPPSPLGGPEVLEVTYQPDSPSAPSPRSSGGPRGGATGGGDLVKAMKIAPWAFSQIRLGGEVELPMGLGSAGPHADRWLVLWSGTNRSDPRLRLERDAVRFRAELAGAPLKLGAAPSEGRLTSWPEHEGFEKPTSAEPSATYADRGTATQVCLLDELKMLRPLRVLEPGDAAGHCQLWTLAQPEDGA